ncbi:IclR family KDG regulon transcriptional repressor [Streptacidiphilus sp. MAP12-16]|uniref:IclR family transcriptional regulator n=1 Tax=Streptacidiphilus sp. MAP12-16 TaxID=3156300 RepID=UPI003518BD62
MTQPAAKGYGLRRDVELLEALVADDAGRRGGLGVVRLAELTGREKSQVSRALKSLEAEGIVERDPDTLEYRIGWRLFSLVARSTEDRLLRVAEPVMHELSHDIGETSHLCELRGQAVLTLLSISPGHAFRAYGWEGRGVPVHCTSAGRVLLMNATPDELAVRFTEGWAADPEQPGGVHSIADLHAQVEIARRAGFALVDEEFEPGLVGASAPIRDFRGRIIAAINISAPKERLGSRLEEAGRTTMAAANRISARLGWEPRHRDHRTHRLT